MSESLTTTRLTGRTLAARWTGGDPAAASPALATDAGGPPGNADDADPVIRATRTCSSPSASNRSMSPRGSGPALTASTSSRMDSREVVTSGASRVVAEPVGAMLPALAKTSGASSRETTSPELWYSGPTRSHVR